ncbi:hypothetical protein CCP2SC5_1350003 [Azospirillaceae bacterium]
MTAPSFCVKDMERCSALAVPWFLRELCFYSNRVFHLGRVFHLEHAETTCSFVKRRRSDALFRNDYGQGRIVMNPGAMLHQYAGKIAARLRQGKRPSVTSAMVDFLDRNLALVFDCLDAFAEHSRSDRENDLAGAYLVLLTHLLEYLRYRVDRNHDWATNMVRDFQLRLVAMANSGDISTPALAAVAGCLREAKLEAIPELVETASRAISNAEETEASDIEPTTDGLLNALIKTYGDDGFAIANGLADAGFTMPNDMRGFLISQIARCLTPALETPPCAS